MEKFWINLIHFFEHIGSGLISDQATLIRRSKNLASLKWKFLEFFSRYSSLQWCTNQLAMTRSCQLFCRWIKIAPVDNHGLWC